MEVKLDQIKGVGPNTVKTLRSHNIWSTYDLILNCPKGYEDFTISQINQVANKSTITVQAIITSKIKVNRFIKTPVSSFSVSVFCETISVIAFGKPYLVSQFKIGDEVIIKGVYHLFKKQLNLSSITKLDKRVPLKPLYKISGLHDRNLTKIITTIFQEKQVSIFETIPKQFLEKYRLLNRETAFKKLHLPKTHNDFLQAKRYFKYEEAFYLQLKLTTKINNKILRPAKKYNLSKVKELIKELPYILSTDQKKAVNDIFRDFNKPYASYRLLQGDVGSGKTVVTLLAIYSAITAGEQVSFMAPTELLAAQHYSYFSKYLKSQNITLLTGKTKNKEQLKKAISNHEYDLVIGTHALIEDDLCFSHLGLVIIDEQHKFGVATRDELIKKAHAKDVLYLSATPIPRTLAMIAFGENNISLIKEKPKARAKIVTHYITKDKIVKLYQAIEKAVTKKEHIFLVVPAISSTKLGDNIELVYQDIDSRFKSPIFVLHGQLKTGEKERIMQSFIKTPGSILIATTMIEVGIDIPTATLMAIYSAEHFGLSQLHQLRGRIGRGTLPSTCFLLSLKDDVERLELLSKIDDGFILSEYDLCSRGPGDFLGEEQSGYLKFNFLDLMIDYPVLIEAQKNVLELLAKPDFKTNPIYKHLNKHIAESLKI